MTPGPPPQQGASLVRALTGPLVLTTLGVLLSLDHLAGYSFGRTWPVLLIVFGLCKLGSRLG